MKHLLNKKASKVNEDVKGYWEFCIGCGTQCNGTCYGSCWTSCSTNCVLTCKGGFLIS